MIQRIKAVPPSAWLAAAALGGLVFLAWHSYARDDQDTDWTTPKETQAPLVVPFPVPGQHGSGSPMSCNVGFRSRAYVPSLAAADFSAVGEC